LGVLRDFLQHFLYSSREALTRHRLRFEGRLSPGSPFVAIV
jgi:hypothetical protein